MGAVHPARIGPITIGAGHPLAFILGPCAIESPAHALEMAEAVKGVGARLGVPVIFKASYDKANRTSGRAFRGPGLEDGLRALAEVRALTSASTRRPSSRPGPRNARPDVRLALS